MRLRALGLVAAVSAVVSPVSSVSAQPAAPDVRLWYEVSESCPERGVFLDLVTARLGYRPFRNDAEVALDVRVVRTPEGFRGRLVTGIGRTREVEDAVCDSVVEALSIMVALEVDPLGERAAGIADVPRRPLSEDLEELDGEEPPAEVTIRPRPPPPASLTARAVLQAHAGGSYGVASRVTLGGGAGVGVRLGMLDLLADFGVESTLGDMRVQDARVNVTLWRAGVSACASFRVFRGCGLVQLGQATLSSDQPTGPNTGRAFVGYGGARVGLRLGSRRFEWGVSLQLLVPWSRPALRLGDSLAWSAPWVSGGLLIELRYLHRHTRVEAP